MEYFKSLITAFTNIPQRAETDGCFNLAFGPLKAPYTQVQL